jgi:ribonuclease P protein component
MIDLKKKNILKESKDFNRIIKKNKAIKFKDYIIYIERVEQEDYHFGLSVGKKIGNAVTRNRVKRQLKSIIDEKDYQNNFNCIIIVGNGILKRSFCEMQMNLFKLFDTLNIYKEESDEEK